MKLGQAGSGVVPASSSMEREGNVPKPRSEIGCGQESLTVSFSRTLAAMLADAPVRNGAADGVLRWVLRKKPSCWPSWPRMAPRVRTLREAAPASRENRSWMIGMVPRARSVKT